jgi:hypothetical protein
MSPPADAAHMRRDRIRHEENLDRLSDTLYERPIRLPAAVSRWQGPHGALAYGDFSIPAVAHGR